MKEFLTYLQISEGAIALYLECLNRSHLSYREIVILSNNLSIEVDEVIDELLTAGLFLQNQPQKPEILTYYMAIPPISSILNYYGNIAENLPQILGQIKEFMINSLDQSFQDRKGDDLTNLEEAFQEIKNDVEEDLLIQSQDVDDIMDEFEGIGDQLTELINELKVKFPKIQEDMDVLHQKIKSITQTQFASLIKTITKIKTVIIKRIEYLELKKKEPLVIEVIEAVFKEKLEEIVESFMSNLIDLIEQEFLNITNPLRVLIETALNDLIESPVKQVIEKILPIRDEFKKLVSNMRSNFESKFKDVGNIILNGKDSIENSVQQIKNKVFEKIDEVVPEALNQVSSLSNPIQQVMKQYYEGYLTTEKVNIDNLWQVKSDVKVNEIIQNILTNSKKIVTLIIPTLEKYISPEQIKNIPETLKVRLVSADSFVSNMVKDINELTNCEFKSLQNENIILLKGDNQVVLGIVEKESPDILNNVIGFATNHQPLMNILSGIIETTWASAKAEEVAPAAATAQEAIQSTTIKTGPVSIKEELAAQLKSPDQPPQELATVSKPQSLGGFVSSVHPKEGDPIGLEISNAFNQLLQKLVSFNAAEFTNELQNVADIILEKKGFSVTMASIRRVINEFKDKRDDPLDDKEKAQIFEQVENWKQRLLA